jgi:hypothetical protein
VPAGRRRDQPASAHHQNPVVALCPKSDEAPEEEEQDLQRIHAATPSKHERAGEREGQHDPIRGIPERQRTQLADVEKRVRQSDGIEHGLHDANPVGIDECCQHRCHANESEVPQPGRGADVMRGDSLCDRVREGEAEETETIHELNVQVGPQREQ